MYTVFSQTLTCHYRTTVLSKATVFYVAVTLLTFIPPLLIAFRSQGFWQRVDFYREQPDVHFKHEVIILLETDNPQRSIAWSTFPNFNQLIADNSRVPIIKSMEHDWNLDGKLDELDVEVKMPLRHDETVYGIHLLLLFDVKLHRMADVTFEGLANIRHQSGLPGFGVDVTGDLTLIQRELIGHKGRDKRFESGIIHPDQFAQSYQLDNILKNYARRNYTVRLENEYTLWKRGVGPNEPFQAKVNIKYGEQTIYYLPGFWQVMKWAWVQYASILIVFIFVMRNIKDFVFSRQILPTMRSTAHLKSHSS